MEPVPRPWQLFLPSSCPCVSSLKQQWEPEEFKTLLLCGFMAWSWFKPSFFALDSWVGTGEFPGINLNYSCITISRCISPKASFCFELLQFTFHFSLLVGAWCSPHCDSIQHLPAKVFPNFWGCEGRLEGGSCLVMNRLSATQLILQARGWFFSPNLCYEQFQKGLIEFFLPLVKSPQWSLSWAGASSLCLPFFITII